ncbi:DUF4282 domain-containing protein [Georgenia sp. Z1344]|uniref:DUF4282 domain-containing protein n=1 Tax=Georgenia sp. Z1344 TaxID=3416706 RepID=UPI003CEB89DC
MTEYNPSAASAPGPGGQPGPDHGYGQQPQGYGQPAPGAGYGQTGGYAQGQPGQAPAGYGAPGQQYAPQAQGQGNVFSALFSGSFTESAVARFASTIFYIGVAILAVEWIGEIFTLTSAYGDAPAGLWVQWVLSLAVVLLKVAVLRGFIEIVVAVSRQRR